MLLRDQIVIQIGEELDGMVMIRSGDNRQGVCPVKFLQEVWQLSEAACQATCTCTCLYKEQKQQQQQQQQQQKEILDKIYYPNPVNVVFQKNNNWYKPKKNSASVQYYYNNINNTITKNNSYLFTKQTNINNNNIIIPSQKLNIKNLTSKAPFSSTKRPLTIRLSTPKHVSNFLMKAFKTDSQKRPLLLNHQNYNEDFTPNFRIIPNKNGLKISSIYTISENVEKFTIKNTFYRRNLYISSNSRPLFVRK